MEFRHPGNLDALFNKPDLSLEDTRPDNAEADAGVCACGEEAGAAYYAWQHNRKGENTTPIIMEFEVSDDAVSIDGRDFLYTVLQLGKPELARPVEWLTAVLAPLQDVPVARLVRLRAALALTVGADSLVILKDVVGLDHTEASDVLKWAAAALLRAGLVDD
jgi:hypothetical protein